MTDDQERIRAKAYELWEAEGRPEGRHDRHWEEARAIIALQDSNDTTLRPLRETIDDPVEPALAVENQGEFPGLTDQTERPSAPMIGEAVEDADVRPLSVEDAPPRTRRNRAPLGEAAPAKPRGTRAAAEVSTAPPPKTTARRGRGTVNGTGENL